MRGASSSVDAALEELYGTEPAGFTKARDAIAKRLKAAGDSDAASAIRARRKPTQMAWVLNQLARRHPDEVAKLVDVGRELAREQRKALRGDETASLRESIDRQRQVVGDLTRTAAKLMTDLGIASAGHLDEVSSALRAALVDPVVGAQLEEGRLEKPPEPAAGFAGPMPEAAGARKETTTPSAKAAAAPPTKETAVHPAKERAVTAREAAAQEEALAKQRAKERAERQANERAKKKALAKERAERQAQERARKKALAKAVAAVRAAEADAKRRQTEAEKAEEEARRAIEHAKKLADAAKASAARAAEARKDLARLDAP